MPLQDISAAVTALLNTGNVVVDRAAVETGLTMLNQAGDFADGLLAHEVDRLGGGTFVSFDKKAVTLVRKQGQKARLLS